LSNLIILVPFLQVRLEEDFVLQLPFLLPEDNYSCDIVRGVPSGLLEFLQPLQAAGLAIITPQPTSSGHWTIYMDTPPPLTPLPRYVTPLILNPQVLFIQRPESYVYI
jgi:hypothetical protein